MSTKLIHALTQGLRGPFIAAIIAFIVGLPCALIVPPLDRDESRFVQASAQMLESNDYINISYQDGPRHKKPVGIHWLQAASSAITAEAGARDILSFRWPSLFGAALAAFALAWGTRHLFDARRGLKAGLILGVSFLLSSEAFIAKTDAVLCGLVTLFMVALGLIYVAHKKAPEGVRPNLLKEKIIFWLALGGSILIKGPIGPMVFLACAFSLLGWDWRAKKGNMAWFTSLGWTWGLLTILLMTGPWALAITIATDGQFWGTAIGDDLAPKLVSGSEGHFAWPGTHTLLLPLLFFPGSFLLGGALQTALSRYAEPAIRFAICWFLPAFLIFEISPTKLVHYPLPTYGGLAILAAIGIGAPLKTWAKGLNMGLGLFGGLVISLLVIFGLSTYGDPSTLPYVTLTVASALLIGGLGGLFLWRNQKSTGLLCLLGAGVAAHLGFVATLAELKPLWVSRALEQAVVDSKLDPRKGLIPGPVAIMGYHEPSFVFAMGTKTELVVAPEKATAAIKQGRPVFVESRFDKDFKQSLLANNLKVKAITVVEGHNYSNGDEVKITLYRLQE
jgi:4-amino-4-deoxy-L-arabinose transferase-like glycosyltransferase